MNKYFYLIASFLIMAGALTATIQDNAGEYGFKFLNIPISPASMALGGRAPDALSDPAAFAYQPAINAVDRQRSLGFSHTRWLGDTDYTGLYYSFSNRQSHFGLILRNLSYGEIEKRDDAGNIIGSYSPLDMGLTANYSMMITPSQYIGVNAGVIYEKLATDSSLGINADLGYTLLPPLQDTKISLAIRNLGISTAMDEESIKLAPSLEIDASRSLDFGDTILLLGASASKPFDEPTKGTVNAQVSLWDKLILRSGYRINYSGNALSAGIGFRFAGFGVDYGWADSVNDLNSIHSFGLFYNF